MTNKHSQPASQEVIEVGNRDHAFGPWLRQAMKVAKINQSQLARRIGVSVATVNRWVNEERTPMASMYEPLARELGLARDVVMEAAGVLEERNARVGPRARLYELLEWMPDQEIDVILAFSEFRADRVRSSMRDKTRNRNDDNDIS